MKLNKAKILCLLTLVLISVSCGKRKPPLPPIENINQRVEQLSGYQQGNRVILVWPAPLRNASSGSVQSIRRIDVYRLAESPDDPLPLTEDEFSSRSVLIGSVPYDEILKPRANLSYVDSLERARQSVRLRYAVRYVNSSGSRASFSNFLLIEPTINISLPPVITGKEESEDYVKISWSNPQQNIDGSTPSNLLGFNVYRVAERFDLSAVQKLASLNSQPLNSNSYSDTTFKFGESYKYIVRTVSLGADGEPIESINSNEITVSPKDVYSPSAPAAVSVAASTGRISLFFPNNPEKDIAGYLIYRSTDQTLSAKDWTKITSELLTRTTFQDANVETGRRYYYYVVAVDSNGNVSMPSEIVSEIVP